MAWMDSEGWDSIRICSVAAANRKSGQNPFALSGDDFPSSARLRRVQPPVGRADQAVDRDSVCREGRDTGAERHEEGLAMFAPEPHGAKLVEHPSEDRRGRRRGLLGKHDDELFPTPAAAQVF